MTFHFVPEARAEFKEAAHWYEERSDRAGDGFVKAARAAIKAILANPARYQVIEGGIRVFRLKKYPYRMYYTFDEACCFVCIHAVMHEKKRPDYWRRRLEDR